MKLGKLIRCYRLWKELDVRLVAKEIGVTPSTLVRIEKGLEPSGRTLALVLRWLMGAA